MKKHYLVDTNVVIDMLLDREDADAACAVFDGAERRDYYLHICALSFTTMFYSLRKILSREDRIDALTQLKEAMEVAAVDGNVIDMALKSGWKDFRRSLCLGLLSVGVVGYEEFLNYLSENVTVKVVVLMARALCTKLGEIALKPVAVAVLSL